MKTKLPPIDELKHVAHTFGFCLMGLSSIKYSKAQISKMYGEAMDAAAQCHSERDELLELLSAIVGNQVTAAQQKRIFALTCKPLRTPTRTRK